MKNFSVLKIFIETGFEIVGGLKIVRFFAVTAGDDQDGETTIYCSNFGNDDFLSLEKLGDEKAKAKKIAEISKKTLEAIFGKPFKVEIAEIETCSGNYDNEGKPIE